jgi:hypothetical protein
MDKAEFVSRAPVYYALAIAVALQRSKGSPLPEFKIQGQFPDRSDSSNPDEQSLIQRWMLWERGVAWLLARNMIKIRYDPFGPPILSQGPDFESQWNELITDDSLPFSAFDAAGRTDDWLVPALHALENTFVNLDMKADDFDNPDAEWSPITIEPDDPTAKKAIASLEEVIDEVRSDNGYSATHPQERDYVLEGLQGTLDKFKSSTVSAGYVRVAFERLGTLGRRFAGTLKEATIAVAKAALMEFAKKHFGSALDYIWKWLF